MNKKEKKEVEKIIEVYHRDMQRAGQRFINKLMKLKFTDNTEKAKGGVE